MINNYNPLIEEKHALIIKLDNNEYQSQLEREKDLLRLSSIEEDIRNETLKELKDTEKEISNIVVSSSELQEMRDIRKITNDKYEKLIVLRRRVDDYLEHIRKKSKKMRELKDNFKGYNKTDKIPEKLKQIVEEILKC